MKKPNTDTSKTQKSLFASSEPLASQDTIPKQEADTRYPEELAVENSFENLSIDALAAEIQRHDALYFTHSAPVISDTLYDRLRERLIEIAPNHPVLATVGAGPIDAQESGQAGKVEHKRPMLSLEKTYDVKGIEAWLIRSEKVLDPQNAKARAKLKKAAEDDEDSTNDVFDFALIASHKIDGLACSLRYDDQGILSLAGTRGDGNTGEDIFQHVQHIENIPKHIDIPNLEVRGEIYMPLSVFQTFTEGLSPRNLAAGALKLKDPQGAKAFKLRFFAYDLLLPETKEDKTQTNHEKLAAYDLNSAFEKLACLETLGFEPVHNKLFKTANLAEIEQFFEEQTQKRLNWDFEIDGIVFKFDDSSFFEKLGATNHHPKSAIAYKFESDIKLAELYGIDWQVARTGVITPLANFESVNISGAFIQRASLANLSRFESLNLRLGDKLTIMRRGGVIPYVYNVATHHQSNPLIEAPKKCPACGAATTQKPPILLCSQIESCSGVRKTRLEYFVNLIKIAGLGPAAIDKIADYDFAVAKNDPSLPSDPFMKPDDLFRLSLEDIALAIGQDSAEAKTAQTLYDNIQSPKTVSLALFLEMVDIPGFDTKLCQTLADDFGSIDAILNTSLYVPFKKLRPYIDALRKHIVVEENAPKKDNYQQRIFAGMRIMLAGRINTLLGQDGQKLTKSNLTKLLKEHGALVVTTPSENLAAIVTGERLPATKSSANPNKAYDLALELAAENEDIVLWTPDKLKELLLSAGAPISKP